MGYYDEVLADSPLAFWKLDESAPSGAGSLQDSAGSGIYDATPNGTIAWNQAGPLADGTGKSGRFNGSTGYTTGGSSLATALMGAANWTIELWFYSDAANGGTIFAAASGGSNRVRIEHFGDILYTSSSVGGNKSSGSLTKTWHHLVLTSTGLLYVDGVSQPGTSNTGLNSTVEITVGALNNGTAFFNGRISCVSLYTSVLSSTRVNAHRDAGIARTVPSGRTFYWDFETDTPNEFPPGSTDKPNYDIGSSRSNAQAFAGSFSLSVGGAGFRSATFDNPTNQHQWATPSAGRVKLRFRYNGTLPSQLMAFQITGKDRSGRNDTNDGVGVRFNATSATLTYGWVASFADLTVNTTIAADAWHSLDVKWRISGSPTLSINVNGTEVTSSAALTIMTCDALHHLLIGNDVSNSPTGMWIDEFETFGSFDGATGSTFNPGLQTGFGFFA